MRASARGPRVERIALARGAGSFRRPPADVRAIDSWGLISDADESPSRAGRPARSCPSRTMPEKMLLDDVRLVVLDAGEAVGDAEPITDLLRSASRRDRARSSRHTTAAISEPTSAAPLRSRSPGGLSARNCASSVKQAAIAASSWAAIAATSCVASFVRHTGTLGAPAAPSNCQTDTCLRLSLVNGSRFQPHQRSAGAAGELSHQVDLGRPDVAERDRDALEAPVRGSRSGARRAPGSRRRTRRSPVRLGSTWKARIVSPGGSRCSSGTPTSMTKQPPGSRCAATFRKHATCSSCVVRFMIVLKTR